MYLEKEIRKKYTNCIASIRLRRTGLLPSDGMSNSSQIFDNCSAFIFFNFSIVICSLTNKKYPIKRINKKTNQKKWSKSKFYNNEAWIIKKKCTNNGDREKKQKINKKRMKAKELLIKRNKKKTDQKKKTK